MSASISSLWAALYAAIDESLDSQFLVTFGDILSLEPLFESTRTLGGDFFLTMAARAQTKALIQIVVPPNGLFRFDFTILEAIGGVVSPTGYRFQGGYVPEPSTLALATLGIVAASPARTRRRRP
jgi:hypothetical protein